MNAPAKTPRGIRLNNPGNIRLTPTKWRGEVVGTDSAFETFDHPENGIRAIARILLSYQRRRGLRTVLELIDRWAPPIENDTDAYALHVAECMNCSVNQVVDLEDPGLMAEIVAAIIKHENGQQPYSVETIKAAVERAYA